MTPPAKALDVAAFIAGHPVDVVCDADVNQGPNTPPPGFIIEAWTTYDTGPIHLIPERCNDLSAPRGSLQFAQGIHTLVHEASHARSPRGLRKESCAELTSDLGVYDVLRRFYGIPFFSARSWLIGGQVLALTRQLPSAYQPEGCTIYG